MTAEEAGPEPVGWKVFFLIPDDGELVGGIKTVDTKLFEAIGRVVNVPLLQLPGRALEAELNDLGDGACCVITHFEKCDLEHLRMIAGARSAKRVRHFHLIHDDPTLANAVSQRKRLLIEAEYPYYDCVVCFGPRMQTRIASLMKTLSDRRGGASSPAVIAITGGMERITRPRIAGPASEQEGGHRTPVDVDGETGLLRPLPEPTSLRILFGSPIRNEAEIRRKGLDLFAQSAGIVQKRLLDRRVDVTNVVLGASGPSQPTSTRSGDAGPSATDPPWVGRIRRWTAWGYRPARPPATPVTSATPAGQARSTWPGYLGALERQLTDWARSHFPEGTTEFEVREYVDRDTLEAEARVAAVMVMPSREEPFGLVAVEALGWGTPVVVSQNSGVGQALLEYASESFLPLDRYVCALTPEKIADSIMAILEHDRSKRLFAVVADGLYERLSWTNAAHQLLAVAGLPRAAYARTIDVSLAARQRILAEARQREKNAVEVRGLLLDPPGGPPSERMDTMYGVPIHYDD